MSDIQIPRFPRVSLLDDPDEETKLAAFRARVFGKWNAAPNAETDGPYLDYSRRFPRRSESERQRVREEVATRFRALGHDVQTGIKEAPVQAAAGVSDAVHNTLRVLDPIVEWLEKNVARLPRYDAPDFGKAKSVTGALVRDTARFVTGFLPALKGAQALGVTHRVLAPTLAAGVGDSLTRDPFEENLFNLVAEHPALAGPVGEFFETFATQPNDPAVFNRLRNGLESALGAAPLAWAFAHQVHTMATARRLGLTLPELGLALRESALHTSTHKAIDKTLQPASPAGATPAESQ